MSDQFEFRTIDGTDNNGEEGASNQILLRLFEPAFEDGIGSPRGGDFDESTLPNPRTISNIVNNEQEPITNFLNASDWLWQWGQFIDHDFGLNEANDANPPGRDDVMFIDVPDGDDTFPDGSQLPFIRVPAAAGTGTGVDNPRETINQITAFIDASSVYGSDEERAEFLRDSSAGPGFLKTSLTEEGEEILLPLNDGTQENATGGTLGDTQFVAGDVRANEQLGLIAVHTLLVREHNRIAIELFDRLESGEAALTSKFERFETDHPLLSEEEALDEFIYESARKVVGAKVQAITYNEFLPILIGEGTLEEYSGYDATVNPQVSTEFANAAYRLGHTLLNDQLREVNGDGVDQVSLVEAFFDPEEVIGGGLDRFLSGLSFQGAQEVDNQLVDGVRNFLFPAGGGGLDLASVNIARGREVGLPGYTEIYEQIFGQEITSFSDLGTGGLGLFSDSIVALFEAAYETVDQIDLWVGGISELPDSHGGLLGPTLSFFIADQFGRSRDGDEFFYLREGEFEDVQLLAPDITETTLSDLIRDNSDNDYLVPDNAFEVPFDNSIFGDNTANILRGTRQRDLIDGLAGRDNIWGKAGDDYLFGNRGNDRVSGGSGNDRVFGGRGSDRLFGNGGNDTVVGGIGRDTIFGAGGNDIIEGQAGSDVLNSGGGRDTFIFGADLLNDGFTDSDVILHFNRRDTLDFSDYLSTGATVSFERLTSRFLRVDLNGEDQINIFGGRQGLDAAEQQLSAL